MVFFVKPFSFLILNLVTVQIPAERSVDEIYADVTAALDKM